jgi:hypothetical protein
LETAPEFVGSARTIVDHRLRELVVQVGDAR